MRILIDVGHPAHVHLFKNFAKQMQKSGNAVLFTCRQKEFEIELLLAEGFDFVSFGKHYNKKIGKVWGLLKFCYHMLIVALRFKPTVFLSHGSIYAAPIAWLLRKPHVSLEDSGNMEQIRIYRPFTSVLLIPDALPQNFGPKQIKYSAIHELYYLHPSYFKPSTTIYEKLGLRQGDKYCILRFVSWKASHDVGHSGLSENQKVEIIEYLSKKLTLFISSEDELPERYKQFQIKISPEFLHDALYYADVVISEGATIASESGLLGTPTIYVNSIVRFYNEEQEKYGLLYNYRSGEGVLEKSKQILAQPYEEKRRENRKVYLQRKINPTMFLIWFIKNYPRSSEIMKENPDYQYKFK